MKKSSAAVQAHAAPDFEKDFMAGVAIDAVIFGFHGGKLKILLLQYENTGLYALPAGFVGKEEDLDKAAKRILKERTGLKNIYLEQYFTFGDMARYNRKPMQQIMQGKGLKFDNDHWLLKRFISVGYYALVDFTKAAPQPDLLADDCRWHDYAKLPRLMLDHRKMITKALQHLRENLDHKLTAFNLLPQTFTMGELQILYETILSEKLLRTSFQRKMINLGILKQVAKKMTGASHKAPYLYRFAPRGK